MRGLLEGGIRLSEALTDCYVLADLSRLRTLPPEARRAVKDYPLLPQVRAIAVVGASFHVRVLSTLSYKAMSLLTSLPRVALRFFDAEAEARAWIDELRRSARANT